MQLTVTTRGAPEQEHTERALQWILQYVKENKPIWLHAVIRESDGVALICLLTVNDQPTAKLYMWSKNLETFVRDWNAEQGHPGDKET